MELRIAALFLNKHNFVGKNLQMRNSFINFVALKYEKNGKYGDYKERRPKNNSLTLSGL